MPRWLRVLVVAVFVVLLTGAGWVVAGLPPRRDVRALERKAPGRTALMRERQKEAKRAGHKARVVQIWVPLSQVSSHLLHAVLASEDQRFLEHSGIDWTALRESVEDNVERGHLWRGGSTLTQQLAKNLFFGTQRTPLRKLRELIVTGWLEEDLSKARILELYVNVIEWGDGIYGCEAAARRWYGRSAAELTREEAAGLAAMIPNPRRINPEVNPRWFARARDRVLTLMAHSGYIGRDVARLGAAPIDETGADLEDDDAPQE
jgi:monofunctional biosynthetic peptidoglycan transglycosylase